MADEKPSYRLAASGFRFAKVAKLEDLQSPEKWSDIPDPLMPTPVPFKFSDEPVDLEEVGRRFGEMTWVYRTMSMRGYLNLCSWFGIPFRHPKFSNHVWHNILRRYERAAKHGRTFKQTVRLNSGLR